MRANGKATVFLDRDGTINVDVGYLSDPDGLILIEGAGRAIARLNREGISVVVVSNQSGVGRGYYTEADVDRVNLRLAELLKKDGARLDAVYYCPHHPDSGCDCRKPGPGMPRRAKTELKLNCSRLYVVGDKTVDIGLAENIGAKGILVLTGDGPEELKKLEKQPHFVATDIADAVGWIMKDLGGD